MSESTSGEHQKPHDEKTLASRDPPTIATIAQSCLDSFQDCLSHAAVIHSRELSLVEDQLARFSIWASNIRALGSGRDSLDHRLREAPDVQEVITGLLEALSAHLMKCSQILTLLSPRPTLENPTAPLGPVDDRLDHILREVSTNVSLLHKFSNAIRKASKATQDLKAARTFEIRDEDGNNVEPFLAEMFARYVLDKFPDADEEIRQRLVATMLIRRKRILYRRSRYGKKPKRPSAQVSVQPKMEILKPNKLKTTQALPDIQHESVEEQASMPISVPQEETQSVAQTATTLNPDKFQEASSPSVISVSQSVALSGHEELVFPPAPCGAFLRRYNKLKKIMEAKQQSAEDIIDSDDLSEDDSDDEEYFETHSSQPRRRAGWRHKVRTMRKHHENELRKFWKKGVSALGEVTCPYCFHAIPAQDAADERKWRAHVKNDLDPYVCLFGSCSSAEELYTHSHTWLKHLREHRLKWKCVSKSHRPFSASSKDEYLQHMRHFHPGKFSEAQLDVLADRNGSRMIGPLFPSCPLCGVDKLELEEFSMENHVVGHLRFLALKSLPAYEENVREEDYSDQDSDATSRPETRSTIRNFYEDGHDSHRDPEYSDAEAMASSEIEGDLVDEHLFDNIPDGERRYFEWPLLLESESSSPSQTDDPTLTTFIRYWHQQEEAAKKKPDKDKAPIRFKDAVGRKFSFPFHLCATWEGMEELIKQAFLHVEILGPHVQQGHYDLVGPNGEIILPQVWDKVIEPDWNITMMMWPMEKPPPSVRSPPAAKSPPAGRSSSRAAPKPQLLQWMTGKPPKKKRAE